MIPAVFQVTFAMLITGAIALLIEQPWNARPDLGAVFAILWLGLLGSGFAYLAFFRLLGRWGATRTTLSAAAWVSDPRARVRPWSPREDSSAGG